VERDVEVVRGLRYQWRSLARSSEGCRCRGCELWRCWLPFPHGATGRCVAVL